MRFIHINKDKQYQEPEVYSTTGFKDVLASPVFYSVVAITFILGASSIFGFLQNPIKLKSTVFVISQKMTNSPLKSSQHRNNYSLSHSNKIKKETLKQPRLDNSHLYLEKKLDNAFNSLSIDKNRDDGLRRIAFNYDITSEQFWTDLDTSTIDSAIEESQNYNTTVIGAPLESTYQGDLDKSETINYTLSASLQQ